MSYPRKEYNPDRPRKYWSLAEAKVKIAAYCAYQERCQEEVRTKLAEKGLYGDQAEELISHMIEEGFLNEERFAQAFARGKFNLKKWGKIKITQELKHRKVSPNCIKSGLKEIEPEVYWQVLLDVVEKKNNQSREDDQFKKKYKIQQYLISRGFESDLVQSAVETFFSGQNL